MTPKPSDVPARSQRPANRPAKPRRTSSESVPVYPGASTPFRVGIPLDEPQEGWDRWLDAIVAALAALVPEPAAGPTAERAGMGNYIRVWHAQGWRAYGPGEVIDLLI